MKITDKANPEYVLKEFCDPTTFHCTTHAQGGLKFLAKVKGACDDPRLCTNEVIAKACKEQCLDLRSNIHGKQDKKSRRISQALSQCSMKQGMLNATNPEQPNSDQANPGPRRHRAIGAMLGEHNPIQRLRRGNSYIPTSPRPSIAPEKTEEIPMPHIPVSPHAQMNMSLQPPLSPPLTEPAPNVNVEPQNVEPQNVEPQNVEPQNIETGPIVAENMIPAPPKAPPLPPVMVPSGELKIVKKAPQAEVSAAPIQRDTRTDLMKSIQAGKELKDANERQLNPPPPENDIKNSLLKAMDARRHGIAPQEEEDTTNNPQEEDEDWE